MKPRTVRRRLINIYKPGSLRVWVIANPPNEGEKYPVESPEHADQLIDAIAKSQLLDANITDNVMGLEVMNTDGEWEDWYDDEGRDIDEYMAARRII